MQKVRKLLSTVMIAAVITAMEVTAVPQLSYQVKADTSSAVQTDQTDNALTQYSKTIFVFKPVCFASFRVFLALSNER